MKNIEIEVKFCIPGPASIRQRIIDLNANSRGRYFETNLRFEDRQNSIIKHKALLRLRKDKKTTLTYKSSPPETSAEFKIFNELEIDVSDFATMVQILEALGFHTAQKYEKWRETFTLDNTLFCLDSMPFGDFLEIEGQKNKIKYFAGQLGLNWYDRILMNYLEIFERLKKQFSLPFNDLTFDNFKTIELNHAQFLQQLRAG